MFEGSTGAAALATVLAIAADFVLLRRRPANYAVAFIQLTFSMTLVGAAWLAETTQGLVIILALGTATKALTQLLFWTVAPSLVGLTSAGAGSRTADRLYLAMAVALLPAYAFLVARGGLGWFRASDIRADYTADNSTPLRIVRHWTPLMVVWGIALLTRRGVEPRQPRTSVEAALPALLGMHFMAYAVLEGSKSASLFLVVIAAGAAQLLGLRIPKRVALPVAISSLALLSYFMTIVAGEWESSLLEAFGLRMVSGSQGLLFAVEAPPGKACGLETVWYPIANFASKVAFQLPVAGYASMGHCLGAPDPSYPWELLVPLLAVAYHLHPVMVPVFALAYFAYAVGMLKGMAWLCRATGVAVVAFPVAYYVAWQLLASLVHGKWTNTLISEFASVLAFIALAAALKRVIEADPVPGP